MLEHQNIKIFCKNLCSKLVWRSFCDQKQKNKNKKKTKQNKKHCREHMLLVFLMGNNCWNFLRKKNYKKQTKEFKVEKILKRKDQNVYVKWKDCKSFFNSWIDKKDII